MKKIPILFIAFALAACGGGLPDSDPDPVFLASSTARASSLIGQAAVPGERRSYDISWSRSGLVGKSKVASLSDFQLTAPEIRLQDTSLSFDADGPGGQLYRLYQAAFGRGPDVAGFGYWKDAIANKGFTIGQVATAFLDSAESMVMYGTSSDDALFVTRLYQNVLGRTSDPAGAAFWFGALRGGTKRAEVLLAFADSTENKAAAAEAAKGGMPFAEPGIAYLPVSNASGPSDVPVGNSFAVDGSGSTDANSDALTYAWSVTSRPPGSTASFAIPTVAKPKITLDVPGMYQLTLWASDANTASYSPAQVTVIAHSLIADSGIYTCSTVDAKRAFSLYSLGHTYLDRDKDGQPCTSADIAFERAPTVPIVPDSGIYKCSSISHEFSVLLYLQGHTYLDRDHDGKPCEATDVAVEQTLYPPPTPPTNSGKCWVNGYTRKDGTHVNGYWRRC